MVRLAALALFAVTVACGSKSQDDAPAVMRGTEGPIAVPGGKSTGTIRGPSSDDVSQLTPSEGTLTLERADAKVGSEATANVVVTPASGYHVNTAYPTKLTLDAPAGVKLAKSVLVGADATTFNQQSLAFAVRTTVDKPGTYTVRGTFEFAVCSSDSCHQKKQPIAIQVAAN